MCCRSHWDTKTSRPQTTCEEEREKRLSWQTRWLISLLITARVIRRIFFPLFFKALEFWHLKITFGATTDSNKKEEIKSWYFVWGLQEPRVCVDRIMRHLEAWTCSFSGEWFFFVSGWIDCVLENVHSLPPAHCWGQRSKHLALHLGGILQFVKFSLFSCCASDLRLTQPEQPTATKHEGP